MEYHDCEYVNIGFNEQGEYTEMSIKRKGSSSEFRMAHDKVIELYKEKRPGRHLADTSKMGVVSVDDQEYVAKQVIPTLMELSPGQKVKIAVLVSHDVFAKVAVDAIRNKTSQTASNAVHQVFEKYETAVAWLQAS